MFEQTQFLRIEDSMSFEFVKKILELFPLLQCFYNINTGHQGHREVKVRGCVVMAT